MSGRSRRGSQPSPRPLAAVLVSLSVLAGLSIALIVSHELPPRPEPSPPPIEASATLIHVDQLAANGLLGQLGTEPFESLRNDVLSQARHALQREPRPGPLPEALGDLRDDGKAALGLAAAFVLGGDSRHGRGVVKYLDAWAAEATLDPICLETECDRTWLIARDLPAFVFAADLIRRSPFMTDEQEGRFADWLVAMRPGAARSDGFQGDAEVLARVVISADAVIFRLAKPGRAEFPQPTFPQYAGHLPESVSEITVGGRPAAMGVSILTPAALPCPTATCPETDAPLFIRLQLQLDGAAVQIETYARVDESGIDQNGYNTESGIVQLAEALTPAP